MKVVCRISNTTAAAAATSTTTTAATTTTTTTAATTTTTTTHTTTTTTTTTTRHLEPLKTCSIAVPSHTLGLPPSSIPPSMNVKWISYLHVRRKHC